jgi:transposase-like protein/RNA polymerase subunit RPABC4/transcription elongation factor Spt4
MPRGIRRQVCPHCQQFNTKRHGILVLQRITLQGSRPRGIQRWYCNDCQRAFTPPRPEGHETKYAMDVQEKVAQLYFDQGASYRAVARNLRQLGIHIDAKRCWRIVQDLAAKCKAPWEISRDLAPSWSGYIAVDGDSVKVASHRESILLGVDLGDDWISLQGNSLRWRSSNQLCDFSGLSRDSASALCQALPGRPTSLPALLLKPWQGHMAGNSAI